MSYMHFVRLLVLEDDICDNVACAVLDAGEQLQLVFATNQLTCFPRDTAPQGVLHDSMGRGAGSWRAHLGLFARTP